MNIVPKRVSKMYLFHNGHIAAFDSDGNQLPELQRESAMELWAYRAQSLGYSVDGCEFHTPHDAGGAGPGGKMVIESDDNISMEWK